MANQGDNTTGSANTGNIRQPQPESAAQDPQAAARQQQAQANAEETRRSAAQVDATTSSDARNKTVHQITEEAEQKAQRER